MPATEKAAKRAAVAFSTTPRRADRIIPDAPIRIASSHRGHDVGMTLIGSDVRPRSIVTLSERA